MIDGSYVDCGDCSDHPCCPHGPTLLFCRQTKNGDRKYYACSACRDRKLCRFFHWADEKYSDERRRMWELEQKKFVGIKSHDEMHETLRTLKPFILKEQVGFCHNCNELILRDFINEHSGHDMIFDVTLNMVMHPTELLKPSECNKKEAQYLFSKSSTKTVIDIALNSKIKSVICIGAPRIHEYIKTEELNLNSILLDFDKRYHTFYKPDDFCWFNAFNFHFFFGETSKQSLINFLLRTDGHGLLLILDPPFGGRLEPLANTVNKIERLYKQLNPNSNSNMKVILIYPYFMEQHVISCFPALNMMDYKVCYDNHPLFSQGPKARKLGSPIRIFTNISLTKVVLPSEEGYKFCKICVCWVSLENTHCKFCNKCTSKNGSTYVHCKKCQKCVKPSWKHCDQCKRCCLKIHDCTSFATPVKCYQCGEEGHKQQDCENFKDIGGRPVVNISNNNFNRKRDTLENKYKKRKTVKNK